MARPNKLISEFAIPGKNDSDKFEQLFNFRFVIR